MSRETDPLERIATRADGLSCISSMATAMHEHDAESTGLFWSQLLFFIAEVGHDMHADAELLRKEREGVA